MKFSTILEAANFDNGGLYKVTTADGRSVKNDEKTIEKALSKSGDFLFTKFEGETITFGQDEEDPGNFFVSGRSPKSFKEFKNFKSAYSYWKKTYRKQWK